jgi:hypothetical protein
VWWGGVVVFGVLLIVCFEIGSSLGERRSARRRAEAETRLAAAQPAPSRTESKATPTPPPTKDAGRPPAPKAPLPSPPAAVPEKHDPPSAPVVARPKEEPPKAPAEPAPPAEPAVELRFAKDVSPVFQAKCVGCHGALSKRGGLDLRTLASTVKGGNSGAGVKPGDPEQSPVWETVRTGQMPPPNKPQLTAEEKKLILAWIANGAK